jgi:DNA-binding transcriptional MerR regulator
MDDIYRITFVTRLRATGMPIEQIKRYTDLAQQGDSTVAERLEILEAHKAAVERKIAELSEHLELISNKIAHYQEFYSSALAEHT